MTASMADSRRRAIVWVAVVVALLLLALLAGRSGRRDGPPLDPESTGPLGTKALVLLLREKLGVEVATGGPLPDGGVVLLLVDDLDTDQRDTLAEWVEKGGTLVTTDARSPLIDSGVPVGPGAQPGDGIPEATLRRRCEVIALRSVEVVRPGGTARFEPAEAADGCFTDGDGSFVVVEDHGAGTIVGLGSPLVWVNDLLGDQDNSVLAAALLAPVPGRPVVLYEPPSLGAGDRGLLDLIPDRVVAALWQLAFAFALVVLWRARRMGRPVVETQPVELAGSELVVAVGNLLQQGRQRDAAARIVRDAGRKAVAERIGVPSTAPAAEIAAVVAARTGRDAATVSAMLSESPVGSDRDLVELARQLDSIREEVAHAR